MAVHRKDNKKQNLKIEKSIFPQKDRFYMKFS